MRKKEALRDPDSPLNRAAEDEPIFVLRGQDAVAPALVRAWVELARYSVPEEKLQEALNVATAMELWRPRRLPT